MGSRLEQADIQYTRYTHRRAGQRNGWAWHWWMPRWSTDGDQRLLGWATSMLPSMGSQWLHGGPVRAREGY